MNVKFVDSKQIRIVRHISKFTIVTGQPIGLALHEALAINRVMKQAQWPIQHAGAIADNIIWQLEACPHPNWCEIENKPKLLLK